MVCVLHSSTGLTTTPSHRMVTKFTPQYLQIMVAFSFSCGNPCKMRKGLDNHLKSCPGCLDELRISCASNSWAVTFGLLSVTSFSKAIKHHSFHVETDAKIAAKYLVEVMWHDKNIFDAESSIPDSPLKYLKCSSAASIRGSGNSSILILEHHCGTKKLEMTIDEHAMRGLLNDLLLDKLPVSPPAAPAFSHSQIQCIQTLMDPATSVKRVLVIMSQVFLTKGVIFGLCPHS
jgi:hypothetical protein